jgi:hypothetical protein
MGDEGEVIMADSVIRERQQQCRQRLADAVHALGGHASDNQINMLSELVIQAMTGQFRLYHSLQHALDVAGTESPREILIGLFHDLVQQQIEPHMPINLAEFVAPHVREFLPAHLGGKPTLRLNPDFDADPTANMVGVVFGFSPGQELPLLAQTNEFLSALAAVKALEPVLPRPELLRLAAGIEATIAFRRLDAQPSEQLLARISKINESQRLGLEETERRDCVRTAVKVANRDVAGFAFDDIGAFLDDTWRLMGETNHELLLSTNYTVRGYRTAVQKMTGFLGSLDPKVVFRHFDDEPDATAHAALVAHAQLNLEVARLYLGAKLVTIAFLEALSLRVSTDASVALIMGDLGHEPRLADLSLERHLPKPSRRVVPQGPAQTTTLQLIEVGRASVSDFDLRHSPLATTFIHHLGFDGLERALNKSLEFLANLAGSRRDGERVRAGQDFIASFDPELSRVVTEAIQKVFELRTKRFMTTS